MVDYSPESIEEKEIAKLRHLESMLLSMGIGVVTFLGLFLVLTNFGFGYFTFLLLIISLVLTFFIVSNILFTTNIKNKLINIKTALSFSTWIIIIAIINFILIFLHVMLGIGPITYHSYNMYCMSRIIMGTLIVLSGPIIEKSIGYLWGKSWSNHLEKRFPYLYAKYVEE